MKKQLITAAVLCLSVWSVQAQQAGLSDYYLATIEQAAQQEPVAGVWLTQSGNLEVQISACGTALCGKVSKVIEGATNNSGAAATPILGKLILEGLTPTQTATWSGKIFNRANGETYACQVRMTSATELEVTPYKDTPEDGRTQVWTRVAASGRKRG